MPVMQQCPTDSPLMKAWGIYQETDDFKNSLIWATAETYAQAGAQMAQDPDRLFTGLEREKHAKGALWAAFMAGFNARADGCARMAGIDVEGE